MKLKLIEEVRESLPKGFIPYDIYGIYVEDKEVGRLILRIGEDEQCYYDGHIGYTVYKEYQGHHYAYKACLLLKDKVKKDHLLITCDPSNIASKKTIERLGCIYLQTKPIPKELQKYYTKEEKEKCIYIWYL